MKQMSTSKTFVYLSFGINRTLTTTNPPFVKEHFIANDVKYDLRTRDLPQIPASKTMMFGINSSIKFLCGLLWNSILD